MSSRALDPSTAAWRKSSHSGSGNACVEVADLAGAGIAVRDSTDPAGPTLTFGHHEWNTLLEVIKSGTDGR
ncbi:DUF397 domain-containing protein [Actinomadura vinacea]|uniref:DUF397 domain-containing protein n=1 Tax=Actinomadura vinacea TaxID=115336 RepID=A0ABP5X6J7_9ACTN